MRSCPACREEFRKDYKPERNINLCEIVNIIPRNTWEDILTRSEGISSSVKNPEVVDGSEHLQTLKRKLTHLTSEIKRLDDIISNKYKTKQQSKDVASATNEFVIMGTFEHLAESKNVPQYVPSELPEQLLDNMTNSLRLGLECLTNALCQLEQLEVPSQDVDTGQNVGAVLQGDQLPAEPSTAAWQQQYVEQTPEDPVTPLQLEGGPSESHSESQGASMELDPGEEATAPAQGASLELDPGEEEAGPSAVLNDCLERLFFSRQKAHRDLTFSDDNCRVQVRRRSLGRPSLSRADHFDISQVMADQEFSSGVHYWEVDTSESDGWAIGVAYPHLGRTENLGRTANSWCLEWSSNKLCFWHNNISEPIKHDRPSKVRIMLDMEGGSMAFNSMTDHMILLHSVEVRFASPVRPAFWLYGLKNGNSLALIAH
ncbi:hypothetical protein SKAU_G00123310 [Synaphobranchus kaupii]|uniref:B30.2/SPRY domain-containing protein n=1 Tax=Synaphobranchus kaupii TaxID=118154 RepID=A0A9Q1J2R2_SYNKA|nr:hypothetical protein SKAU_G00123310 [Synaphobranchus kaupii]